MYGAIYCLLSQPLPQGNPNRPKHTSKQQHEPSPEVPDAAIPAGNEPEPQSNTPQRESARKEPGSAHPTPQPMEVREVACELQRKLHLVEDVDEGDRENIVFCADYVKDIYQYLQRLEKEVSVSLVWSLPTCKCYQKFMWQSQAGFKGAVQMQQLSMQLCIAYEPHWMFRDTPFRMQ